MSRPSAVLEKSDGFVSRNLPAAVTASLNYRELRSSVASYAWAREEFEGAQHRARGGQGLGRSHYRCLLSFEKELPTATIKRLVLDWLSQTLPRSSACAFVHRNTEHVHAHIWIDSRGTDGKKLDISRREWKSLGERWMKIYQRELSRMERLSERFGDTTNEQSRASGEPDRAPGSVSKGALPEPAPSSREQEALLCSEVRKQAVREALSLRKDLEGMGRDREAIDHSIER